MDVDFLLIDLLIYYYFFIIYLINITYNIYKRLNVSLQLSQNADRPYLYSHGLERAN